DGAGRAAFRGMTSFQPAPLLNVVVRPLEWRTICPRLEARGRIGSLQPGSRRDDRHKEENVMESRLHPGDEQNGSFEPAIRPSQIIKPGIERGHQRKEDGEGGSDRRVRSKAKEIPQASLAKRIREREGK